MPFWIDSNVLIDVSRGHLGAIQYIDRLAQPWALSQVTAMDGISLLAPGFWAAYHHPPTFDGLLIGVHLRSSAANYLSSTPKMSPLSPHRTHSRPA